MPTMNADKMTRLGTIGDYTSETYGGGPVYQDASGRVFLEYTHGAECEEGAFSPDEPQPRCEVCKGTGEMDAGRILDDGEHGPEADSDTLECQDCHGKGHLFAFEVYRVDVEADVIADLDWVDWADVARFIDMPEEELRDYAIDPNPMARASVYEAVGSYHGWGELDSYPLLLTEWELEQRWAE